MISSNAHRLDGQVALVTGAARGIGRGIARQLAQAGAAVAVADLDAEGARRVADELRGAGAAAVGIGGNVARAADRDAIVQETEQALGPIDVLVNNAGINQVVDIWQLSEADWDRIMDVNAKAVFFMCQRVLPGMVARRRGAVINMASAAGKLASTVVLAHYNASKAAVIAMTKTFARAVARDGVRVNCVCPGMIDTDMWTMIDREWGAMLGRPRGAIFQDRIEQVPMGRAGTAEDVAKVVLFLASDLAGYMTGQAVNVTGGWVTH